MLNMVKPTIKRLTNPVSDFFGCLMSIRDTAHLTHLAQRKRSGWEHSALNKLYEDIIDQVDTIIESYQGIYGIVEFSIPSTSAKDDSVAFVTEMYDYIMSNRYIFSESWLQNEIDNVCTLLAQTLYRLKFVQ